MRVTIPVRHKVPGHLLQCVRQPTKMIPVKTILHRTVSVKVSEDIYDTPIVVDPESR